MKNQFFITSFMEVVFTFGCCICVFGLAIPAKGGTPKPSTSSSFKSLSAINQDFLEGWKLRIHDSNNPALFPVVTSPPEYDATDDVESAPKLSVVSKGYSSFGDSTIRVEGTTEKGFQNIAIEAGTREEPDIRHWVSVSIANYRERVKPKLQSSQPLNKFDLDSIRLCLDSYHAALTTYCKVALQSMLTDPSVMSRVTVKEDHRSGVIKYTASYAIAGIYGIAVAAIEDSYAIPNADVAVTPDIEYRMPGGTVDVGVPKDGMVLADAFLQKACQRFEEGDSSLCRSIQSFGALFEQIDPTVLAQDVVRAMNGMTKSVSYWNYRGNLLAYQKLSCSPDVFQAKWKGLQGSISFYVEDLEEILTDIDSYMKQVKDSNSRMAVEDLYNESIENTRLVMNTYRHIFTDVPFTVICKKAYAETRRQVSAIPWGNDELRMLETARKFNRFIGQTAMLRQIRSPNSANIYRQYLTYLEREVGKKRYKTLVQETRLVNLDSFHQAEEPFEQNRIEAQQSEK